MKGSQRFIGFEKEEGIFDVVNPFNGTALLNVAPGSIQLEDASKETRDGDFGPRILANAPRSTKSTDKFLPIQSFTQNGNAYLTEYSNAQPDRTSWGNVWAFNFQADQIGYFYLVTKVDAVEQVRYKKLANDEIIMAEEARSNLMAVNLAGVGTKANYVALDLYSANPREWPSILVMLSGPVTESLSFDDQIFMIPFGQISNQLEAAGSGLAARNAVVSAAIKTASPVECEMPHWTPRSQSEFFK